MPDGLSSGVLRLLHTASDEGQGSFRASMSGIESYETNKTDTGKANATVTTFRCRSALLDVKNPQVTTRGLDDTSPVGRRVVAAK